VSLTRAALTALIKFADRHPRAWSVMERWAAFLWRHRPDLVALDVALSVVYGALAVSSALNGSWGYAALFAALGAVSAVAMWRLRVAVRAFGRACAEFRDGAA
jgi:hypothetical protein